MAKTKVVVNKIPPELKRSWAWLLALGILFVILGCIGLGMVVGLTLASMLFLGVLLISAGLAQIVDVFKSKHWKGAIWHAIIALLYLIGGGVVIYDPLLASTIVTALLAWIFIVIGITRLSMAAVLRRSKGWVWLVIAGIAAIVLGVLILLQWPYSGLWVLGLFIAIEILVNGWTYIFLALSLRRA